MSVPGEGKRLSEVLAVGSLSFVEKVKSELGLKAEQGAVKEVPGRILAIFVFPADV